MERGLPLLCATLALALALAGAFRSDKCGGTIKIENPGYLTSPGYPHSYHPSEKCEWLIQAPEPYQRIMVAAKNKMAGRISAFLKNAWAKEPVLVVSFSVWGLAIIMPMISPYTKYASMINKATPYNYPVPVRDDGNMPDVPSHPQDPLGPSLDWLKNL